MKAQKILCQAESNQQQKINRIRRNDLVVLQLYVPHFMFILSVLIAFLSKPEVKVKFLFLFSQCDGSSRTRWCSSVTTLTLQTAAQAPAEGCFGAVTEESWALCSQPGNLRTVVPLGQSGLWKREETSRFLVHFTRVGKKIRKKQR